MVTKKVTKRKVIVTLEAPTPVEKTFWQKVKDKFYNSGTIMLNWGLGVFGLLGSSVIGIFSTIDWTSPLNMLKNGTTFNKEQWIVIGGSTFLLGVVGYFTRISGTKEVEGHLLPKSE